MKKFGILALSMMFLTGAVVTSFAQDTTDATKKKKKKKKTDTTDTTKK